MTTQSDNHPPTLESIAEGQQHLISAVMGLSESVQAVADGQHHLSERVQTLDERVQTLADGQHHLSERVQTLADGQHHLGGKLDILSVKVDKIDADLAGTNQKLDGLKDDIGLVKGGHARNEIRHRVSLIADDLNYTFTSEIAQDTLIAFSKTVAARGVAKNEVESFRNADLIIMVKDAGNQESYIAVEVSFTVSANDVRRAMRNANYLQEFVGVPSCAVVAGVDILPEAKRQVDDGKIHWYQIPKRVLHEA